MSRRQYPVSLNDTNSTYLVIVGNNSEELTARVNAAMLEGWKPTGGVSVVPWKTEHYAGYSEVLWLWSQAVTREAMR